MIREVPDLISDIAAARKGSPDAAMRLARQAARVALPQYMPVIEGAERLASHLGLRLTSEGLDITGLHGLLTGETAGEGGPAGEPWAPFINRIRALKSGAVLVLGPRGEGKTCLATRLAEVWRAQHGYEVLGINMYPEDRKPWIRGRSIKLFADGMESLVEALEAEEEPPASLRRKVVIIDEASLSLHPQGEHKASVAVQQAIRQARHIQWLVIVVAHLTKDLPVAMNWVDAIFVKRPTGREVRADREEARELWESATQSYAALQRGGLRGKPIQGWVYADAADLGYEGMMPYLMAGDGDPRQGGGAEKDAGEGASV